MNPSVNEQEFSDLQSPDTQAQPNKNGRTHLHVAALRNEADMVTRLIASGAKVDAVDDQGSTPLALALVSQKDKKFCSEATKILLKNGANPNQEVREGNRVLHLAIAAKNLEGVSLLLSHGAETNYRFNNLSLLHCAVITKSIPMTKLFVGKNIGLNEEDAEGKTPLHYACIQESFEIIESLLENKDLDINKKCSRGMTAFHYATEHNNIFIMALLNQNGAKVNTQNNEGDTPLHTAVSKNAVAMVQYLMMAHADITIMNKENKTPRDYPNASERVREILSENEIAGIPLARFCDNTNPLLKTAYNAPAFEPTPTIFIEKEKFLKDPRTTHLMKLMIDMEANEGSDQLESYSEADTVTEIIELINTAPLDELERVGVANITALHLAAYNMRLDFIAALHKRGVKIDPVDDTGCTPLQMVRLGFTPQGKESAEFLIKKGANINHVTNSGSTALHLAAVQNELELSLLFLQHGGKINAQDKAGRTPLIFACSEGNDKIAKTLLTRNASTDLRDRNHWGPPHHAARKGSDECIKLLIKHMKKVDSHNNDTVTPFQIAVNENKLSTAKLLLEAGANINHKTSFHKKSIDTALHSAIIKNNTAMVEFLLENNASMNETSAGGKTTLELALDTKNINMLQLILKHKTNLNFNEDFVKKHRAYAKKIEFREAIPLLKTELQIEPVIKPSSPPKKEKKPLKLDETLENLISPEEEAKRLEDEAKKKEEDRLKRKTEEDKRASEEAKIKETKKRELEVKKAKEALVKQAFNEIYDTLSKFTSSKGATKDFLKGGMRKTAESFIDSQDKDYVQNGTNIVDRLMLAQDILSSTGMKKTNPKLFEDLKQQFADAEKPVLMPASPTEVKANTPAPTHADPMVESQDDQKAFNKLLHDHEKLQNSKAAEARKKQASSSTSAPLLMAPQSQVEAEQIRRLIHDLVLLVTPYQDGRERSLLEMKYDIVKMDVIVSQLNKTAGKRMMEALFANTEEISIIRNGALHLLETHSEHQHYAQEEITLFFMDFYRTILERVSVLATLNIQPDTRLSHTLSRIQGQAPVQLCEIIAQTQNPPLAQETYKQFELNYRNHQLNKDNARSDVDDEIRNRIGILAHSGDNKLSDADRIMLAVEIAELYRQRGNAGIKNGFMPYALIEARHDFAHQGKDIPEQLIHELLTEYASASLKHK
jgi:ankyrin repeat protein